ncbi:hypothetical protein cce_5050 [Crocosphaera subtropica ATCC 51142]|uniref:Uncharacterized protein n=1 Tax=Crocosphaera subtropica (strain ATCC 51142 / BH68) TaxID=43989 RepID=B1X2N5_CROS5|nr:hypothetical protein [Crocosphaera subtropica]ACB54396.1 hypothetical protein cce_5050 [Crocosphaera subtropica ATCC 51142]
MDNQDNELKVTSRFSGEVAENLRELKEIGNFQSLNAAVQHIVGTYVSSVVKGIKSSQQNVELSIDSYFLHGGGKN